MPDQSIVYAKVKKSDTQEIRISVDTFKEHEFFSVRLWYKEEGIDEWRPTQKGITGPIDEPSTLDGVIKGLQKLRSDLFGNE